MQTDKFLRIIFFNIVLIITLIFMNSSVSACTSFAVFGNKIYYGMNFDYPDTELRFQIFQYNDRKIFQGLFIQDGNEGTICGMNRNGLFSSMQMLYPEINKWPEPKENEINLYQAYLVALLITDSLQDAYNFIDTNKIHVIHIDGITIHDFFADKNKQACVLEVGAESNLITKMENDFIVMTNFPVNQFAGKPLSAISGVGADRYITAFNYIQAHKDNFNFDNGIETLRRTVQKTGDYKTQCSLLFDPVSNEVFIVIKRDFTKIWKVSIDNDTIETYSGFDNYKKIVLDSAGITASELQNITSVNNKLNLIPTKVSLSQNYPNPFNPSTTIEYSAVRPGNVKLTVYNILGQEISVLLNEFKEAGNYKISFNASNLASGFYFYSLETGQVKIIKRMILIK